MSTGRVTVLSGVLGQPVAHKQETERKQVNQKILVGSSATSNAACWAKNQQIPHQKVR